MEKPLSEYQFLKKLENLSFVEHVFLFGSRARGTNQPRSDIDIAIDCPTASAADWHTVMNIIEEADTLIKVDCVRLNKLPENDPFRKNILRDAVELYAKH